MNQKIRKVQEKIAQATVDAALISSITNITYLSDFANFSPDEREAFLLITHDNQYVITDPRYSEEVKKHHNNFTLLEISTKIPLKKLLTTFCKKKGIRKVGFEVDNLTVDEYKKISKIFQKLKPLDLSNIRAIKTNKELQNIEKACQLGDETFAHSIAILKEGITEKEVSFTIEFFIKKQGADISFKPIVAFGKNSSVPHHQTSNQQLKTNDIILLDFGVKIRNYCSDMTRIVFFGKATNEKKRMYQTVLTAQQKAFDYISSCHSQRREESREILRHTPQDDIGIKASEVDKMARDYITSQGYPIIPHSLGHGIGIAVHESPSLSPKSKDVLQAGMIFSIEPGIYIPGVGGIRIEDLVILEQNGPRILTKSPRNLTKI